MLKKVIKRTLFLVFTVLFSLTWITVNGQSINPNDLSNIQVDQMSDAQIRAYMLQAQTYGYSEAQLEEMALQRGMPPAEVQKLRTRIAMLDVTEDTELDRRETKTRPAERVYVPDTTEAFLNYVDSLTDWRGKTIFGSSVFKGVSATFEPNLRMATPVNYVLGAGDQLLIDVYGRSEVDHALTVSPEGRINIPYVGIVTVGGLTIERATSLIESRMATVYSELRSGRTKVVVALGNIRSINVVLTGDVIKPGTYTLPSVATAFNALYQAGGPNAIGSFRNIQVIRGGQVISTLDIYDLLIDGVFEENIVLQDQDIIMVPRYVKHVELTGEVNRPYIFELTEQESFADVIRYAGGFTEKAYQARVKVNRYTERELRIEDVLQSQFGQFIPQSGDNYTIEGVLERYENRVSITGSVFRPGEYELSAGLTLSMLLKKAEGVREDTFMERGTITRLGDDLQTNQISFNIAGILAGTDPDILLKREDVIQIYSIFELREAYHVKIGGEVRSGGKFDYADGMTLQDLILRAGGFREGATSSRIEVARRIRNADPLSTSTRLAEVFQVDIGRGLTKEVSDFVLLPFDEVVVRTAAGYEIQRTVRIEGEVLFPGKYALIRKDERISDLIERAGGFTSYAYLEGASLRRRGASFSDREHTQAEAIERESAIEEERNRLLSLQQLQSGASTGGMLDLAQQSNTTNYVGINMDRIVSDRGSRGDLILEDGDIVRVPRELQTVKISGEVLAPSIATYSPSKGLKQYITQAGGFSQRAVRKNTYVLYANGSVKGTTRFLFFNNYPVIKPGAEIFVPQRPLREALNAQQWIGLSTGLASLAAIILTLLR